MPPLAEMQYWAGRVLDEGKPLWMDATGEIRSSDTGKPPVKTTPAFRPTCAAWRRGTGGRRLRRRRPRGGPGATTLADHMRRQHPTRVGCSRLRDSRRHLRSSPQTGHGGAGVGSDPARGAAWCVATTSAGIIGQPSRWSGAAERLPLVEPGLASRPAMHRSRGRRTRREEACQPAPPHEHNAPGPRYCTCGAKRSTYS